MVADASGSGAPRRSALTAPWLLALIVLLTSTQFAGSRALLEFLCGLLVFILILRQRGLYLPSSLVLFLLWCLVSIVWTQDRHLTLQALGTTSLLIAAVSMSLQAMGIERFLGGLAAGAKLS